MNVAVRYFTRTGNTRKLAEAIAAAVDAQALDVSVPLKEKVDILFLGSSVYAGGVDGAIKEFIRENAANIGCIVNFSTAALIQSTYRQVKRIAQKSGVAISEQEFHCRGAFAKAHRGRPNEEDCAAAAEFAKRTAGL